jgi:hypothetical protein
LANLEPPFGVGNLAAVKHGAQAAAWRLAPRTLGIADSLRPLVPGFSEGDEVTLRLLALVLARLELAELWLGEQGTIFRPGRKGETFSVVRLMSTWEAQAAKLASSLGLSPASRARIGSDVAGAGANRALEAHVRQTYGGES